MFKIQLNLNDQTLLIDRHLSQVDTELISQSQTVQHSTCPISVHFSIADTWMVSTCGSLNVLSPK